MPTGKGPDDKTVDKGNVKGPDRGQDKNNDKDKNTAAKDEPKPMVVPPEAKQKQDVAFLKGDWRSRTGLATATGERNIRPSYTLDDKGKGKVSFVQKNGTTCEAPAEARWDGAKLVIEEKVQSQVRRRAHLCPQYGQLRGRRRRRRQMHRQPARRQAKL